MRRKLHKYGILFVDLMAIAASFPIGHWLRYSVLGFLWPHGAASLSDYTPAMLLAVAAWILVSLGMELDRISFGPEFSLAASRLVIAWTIMMAALLVGLFLALNIYSRLALILIGATAFVLLLLIRLGHRRVLRQLYRNGRGLRRTVIVGESDLARELAERFRSHRELACELVGFLYPATLRAGKRTPAAIGGNSEEIVAELKRKQVDELIFTIPIQRNAETLEFIAACLKQGIAVKLVPDYYELHARQVRSFSIDGIPILELKESSIGPFGQLLKRIMDCSLVTVFLVFSCPVMALIGLALRWVVKGPTLEREVRVGLGGRPFVLYRFNTHLDEGSSTRGKGWAVRFCEFLRRYSLSELPQLWNILKGEMSIVGPRPETPERVRHYSEWHRRRLVMKPGITGLAQVRGLRGFHSTDEKTRHDLEYFANYTPLLDLVLIAATAGALLRRRNKNVSEVPSPRFAAPSSKAVTSSQV